MTSRTETTLRVIHSLPGRMRLELGGGAGDWERVAANIRRIQGVRNVCASPITGNVLITYDAQALRSQSLLERVSGMPLGRFDAEPTHARPPVRRSRARVPSGEPLHGIRRPSRVARPARRSVQSLRPEVLLKSLSIVGGALSGGPLAILLAALELFLLLSDHGVLRAVPARAFTPSLN